MKHHDVQVVGAGTGKLAFTQGELLARLGRDLTADEEAAREARVEKRRKRQERRDALPRVEEDRVSVSLTFGGDTNISVPVSDKRCRSLIVPDPNAVYALADALDRYLDLMEREHGWEQE